MNAEALPLENEAQTIKSTIYTDERETALL